jgi:hypothetical protein
LPIRICSLQIVSSKTPYDDCVPYTVSANGPRNTSPCVSCVNPMPFLLQISAYYARWAISLRPRTRRRTGTKEDGLSLPNFSRERRAGDLGERTQRSISGRRKFTHRACFYDWRGIGKQTIGWGESTSTRQF